MCGIAGTCVADREQASADVAARMVRALSHRGPDDSGMLTSGPLAMGMTRLSIVDLSGGHQPISNEDGTIHVVCNGEIYNHLELRRELAARGHAFRSRSDVEVIVHLYEEYGDRFVAHLTGMFAFALWDERTRRL